MKAPILFLALSSCLLLPEVSTAGFVSGQSADMALGGVSPSGLIQNPEDIAVDPATQKVFVADASLHRVLRFSSAASLENGGRAEAVFGAPDLLDRTSGTSSNQLTSPQGICIDAGGRLWVADSGNNRVLRFDNVTSKSSGASADGVLGQPDFVTATSATTSSKFNRPESVSVSSSGTLYVAERNNRRVLRFDNAASLADGANASRVYGQPDFVSNSSGITASTVSSLSGVLVTPDDTLWVNDRGNERLLRFDNISSKPSGAAADGVVGQKDFTSSDDTTSARGPIDAYGQPHLDPKGNLWIADTENNRVLRFPPDVTKPLLTVKKPAKK
ncbi:MAG: NHL repeat-containing protein, partial [Verrucomicrobiae bacterium]|nr:NHL repeat-containing protein [Verrucomicrobiae bacterium]